MSNGGDKEAPGAANEQILALPVIGLCALAYFLDGVIHTIMGPMAPEIARALNISHAELGPIFSARRRSAARSAP